MSKTILLASVTIFITFLLIKFPDQTLEASIRGLNMWWEVVFPSLLPFFITAELLISFGVVNFIGVLFEPIMRPVFNVPGSGSFAWVMGMASGYPSGAKMSVRLREEMHITQTEAERLLSFTNASSPLFIFGAISVGFFHDAKLGLLIALTHYIGNALVGICMRFYGNSWQKNGNKHKYSSRKKVSLRRAFKEMHDTRLKDPRPFGEIVGDAVINSVQTLVMVGGFIILFSVFTKLLFLIGISPMIAYILEHILAIFQFPTQLSLPFLSGLFEISLGSQMISLIESDSLLPKVILVNFILGFNGFSVQAQVASIIAKTDIRFKPYLIGRILHGIFASMLTIIFYKPFYLDRQVFDTDDLPVVQDVNYNYWTELLTYLKSIGPLFTIFCLSMSSYIIYRKMRHS